VDRGERPRVALSGTSHVRVFDTHPLPSSTLPSRASSLRTSARRTAIASAVARLPQGDDMACDALIETLLEDGRDCVTHAATYALPPDFAAVPAARAFVRETLSRWRVSDLSDDVTLVATELVVNALRHGCRLTLPDVPTSPVRNLRPVGSPGVELRLVSSRSRLICGVNDPSDDVPESSPMEPLSRSGRGLHLIECLSSRWGWIPRVSPGHQAGKTVWALFALAHPYRPAARPRLA